MTLALWLGVTLVDLLLGTMPTTAQGDLDAPHFARVEIDPQVFSTATRDVTVTFTARITDDLSGVDWARLHFQPDAGGTQQCEVDFYPRDRVSGDDHDGVYVAALTLPQYSAEGRWTAVAASAIDQVGNLEQHLMPTVYFVNGVDDVPVEYLYVPLLIGAQN